jgi:hypothetical protein
MKSRSLLVQIRPPQPKNPFYQQLPRTIRIDNFEFQSNASERTADDKLRQNIGSGLPVRTKPPGGGRYA